MSKEFQTYDGEGQEDVDMEPKALQRTTRQSSKRNQQRSKNNENNADQILTSTKSGKNTRQQKVQKQRNGAFAKPKGRKVSLSANKDVVDEDECDQVSGGEECEKHVNGGRSIQTISEDLQEPLEMLQSSEEESENKCNGSKRDRTIIDECNELENLQKPSELPETFSKKNRKQNKSEKCEKENKSPIKKHEDKYEASLDTLNVDIVNVVKNISQNERISKKSNRKRRKKIPALCFRPSSYRNKKQKKSLQGVLKEDNSGDCSRTKESCTGEKHEKNVSEHETLEGSCITEKENACAAQLVTDKGTQRKRTSVNSSTMNESPSMSRKVGTIIRLAF